MMIGHQSIKYEDEFLTKKIHVYTTRLYYLIDNPYVFGRQV